MASSMLSEGDRPRVWDRRVTTLLLAGYGAGFAVTALAAGPWEAARTFAAEGLILFLWLAAAGWLLRGRAVEDVPVLHPRLELGVGLAALPVLAGGAVLYYLGYAWAINVTLVVLYALPLIFLFRQPAPWQALGLRWPPGRGWLVLLAAVTINAVGGVALGNLLPPGELPTPPGADLSDQVTGILPALLLLGRLALVAAVPEELFFRVFLQPRFNRYMPIGLAILAQALLFSAVHLPQGLIHYGETWPLALAGVLTIANGVMGGYLWYRARSLPLIVLLHLFAYPRIGL